MGYPDLRLAGKMSPPGSPATVFNLRQAAPSWPSLQVRAARRSTSAVASNASVVANAVTPEIALSGSKRRVYPCGEAKEQLRQCTRVQPSYFAIRNKICQLEKIDCLHGPRLSLPLRGWFGSPHSFTTRKLSRSRAHSALAAPLLTGNFLRCYGSLARVCTRLHTWRFK
jgi:hypothetical protein